ncbi:hypothetical protein BDD12DRAFT_913260 [Trichophaea hybrida]|nr:hypothetical protein BDD12DRAFT_913260 [Trichophaea hybrida]
MITTAPYNSEHIEIMAQLTEAIVIVSRHWNQIPLQNTPGAPSFHGIDVTIFLHNQDVISMFPYYCAEGLDVREKVIMMPGYERRDWAALKKEMLDAFRYTDSRPDSLAYTCQYLEQLCGTFGGRDNDT